MDSTMYLQFPTSDGYEVIELPASSRHLLLHIPHFKRMSIIKNFNGVFAGSSAAYPISFSSVPLREFMGVLKLLELQHATHGIPFTNPSITFKTLISENWGDLDLPDVYLNMAASMTPESLVLCLRACCELSLFDVRQLLIYRMIHLLYKSCEVGPTMETLVKIVPHYYITIFQKQCRKMILALDINDDKKSTVRVRSNSF